MGECTGIRSDRDRQGVFWGCIIYNGMGTLTSVEGNVNSIMLEVNRKLYLNEGSSVKSDNYKEIKNVVQGFLSLMTNIDK